MICLCITKNSRENQRQPEHMPAIVKMTPDSLKRGHQNHHRKKRLNIKLKKAKRKKKQCKETNNMGVENLSILYKVFKKGFIRCKKNLDFNTSKTKVSCSNKSCSDNPTSIYSEPPQGVWELYHLCLWIHLIRKISIQHFVCIVCTAIPYL